MTSKVQKNDKNTDSKVQKIGPWVLGSFLGQGFAAQVREVQHEKTGQKAAIKILTKDDNNEKADLLKKMREKEIIIMKLVDHPNIVRLYDVYETATNIYLVMELLQGSLFSYVVKSVRISPSKALGLFQQIIEALDYMHRHLICHRDLKPENFLLNSQTTLKVCDFGFASLMKEDDEMQRTRCGTLHYASPDILTEGDGYDGRLHDVWSAGVNLYVMVTGELPFNDKNPKILLRKITTGTFEFPPQVPLPYDLKDLIFRMLTVDSKQRITIPEIKRHPWYCSKPYTVPQDVVSHINIEEPFEDIDEQILNAIVLLSVGWDNTEDIFTQLKKKGANSEKVVYLLLLRKKLNPSLEAYSYSYVEKIQRAASVSPDAPSTINSSASATTTTTNTSTNSSSHTTNQTPPVAPISLPDKAPTEPPPSVISPRATARSGSTLGREEGKKKKLDINASFGRSSHKKIPLGKGPDDAEQNQAVSSIDKILNWFSKKRDHHKQPESNEAEVAPEGPTPDEQDPVFDLLMRSTQTPKKGDLRIRSENPNGTQTIALPPNPSPPKTRDEKPFATPAAIGVSSTVPDSTPPLSPVEPQESVASTTISTLTPTTTTGPSVEPKEIKPEDNHAKHMNGSVKAGAEQQADSRKTTERKSSKKTSERKSNSKKSQKSSGVSIYVNFIPSDQSSDYEHMQRNHNGIPLQKCLLQYRDSSGNTKQIYSRADLEAVTASGIAVECIQIP
eukprot:TRINITY_DN4382_c0_g1_i1.p1 TRINITY_DN4382_c0_g1~~TRINITY_DN4382_c0_g1_i1.p1  ORF type:complete len:730 (-),score=147.28 TRINITY_DN4382_c0_g1_i1:35-2224(-)